MADTHNHDLPLPIQYIKKEVEDLSPAAASGNNLKVHSNNGGSNTSEIYVFVKPELPDINRLHIQTLRRYRRNETVGDTKAKDESAVQVIKRETDNSSSVEAIRSIVTSQLVCDESKDSSTPIQVIKEEVAPFIDAQALLELNWGEPKTLNREENLTKELGCNNKMQVQASSCSENAEGSHLLPAGDNCRMYDCSKNAFLEKCDLHRCDICQKHYKGKRNLRRHKRRFHSEMAIHKGSACYICINGFKHIEDLELHMQTHTLEMQRTYKRYSCVACEMSFTSKINLKKHTKLHGANFGSKVVIPKTFKPKSVRACQRVYKPIKIYDCNICQKTFRKSRAIQIHMRTHRPKGLSYVCDLCQKECKRAMSLKYHMKTHFGKQTYSCEICQKTYIQKLCYEKHMKIHSRDKTHICDVCQIAFFDSSDMHDHMQTHVTENSRRLRRGLCSLPEN